MEKFSMPEQVSATLEQDEIMTIAISTKLCALLKNHVYMDR